MKNKIRKVLKAVAKDPSKLTDLKENPEKFGHSLELDKESIDALKSADLLLVSRPANPLIMNSTQTITFTTGMTITGSPSMLDRVRLADLTKEELVTLVNRILVDQDHFQRVSNYLNV
ncbi:MAG: hypothetical protein ACPGJS_07825 [Flammeovirgaceae bacterium]